MNVDNDASQINSKNKNLYQVYLKHAITNFCCEHFYIKMCTKYIQVGIQLQQELIHSFIVNVYIL